MRDRLVCYSLAMSNDGICLRQLLRGIASLRRHNASIPVWVMVYGTLPEAAEASLHALQVEVRRVGEYAGRIRDLSNHAEALSSYPVLPKYLSLSELANFEIGQLLCLDCDSFFFGDVSMLFDRYGDAECYGREEPWSPLSSCADAGYLDPVALASLFESQALRTAPTLNTGALLMNRGLHRKLAPLLGCMLDDLSRLMMGLTERFDSAALPFVVPSPAETSSPLPFPSSNPWIVDEMAFWLTLGRLPQLSSGLFSWQDFLQGQEFTASGYRETPAIACHYFSVNEETFCRWLEVSAS